MPKYSPDRDYYQEFWKAYILNEMVMNKVAELTAANQQLQVLTGRLEELYSLREQAARDRPKKKRRTSAEINKIYKCLYPNCSKSYGCDVAVNLHIKLKHNGGNKTEREELAVPNWLFSAGSATPR